MKKKLKKAAVVLGFSMLCIACGQSTEKLISEQEDLGQQYLSEENYKEAAAAFSKMLELDPKYMTAYVELANIYMEQEMDEELCEVFDKALSVMDTLSEKEKEQWGSATGKLRERIRKYCCEQLEKEGAETSERSEKYLDYLKQVSETEYKKQTIQLKHKKEEESQAEESRAEESLAEENRNISPYIRQLTDEMEGGIVAADPDTGYFIGRYEPGKGDAGIVGVMNPDGNKILNWHEGEVWFTENGFALIEYYDETETEQLDEWGIYDAWNGALEAVEYVSLFDWNGDRIERTRLEANGTYEKSQEARARYPEKKTEGRNMDCETTENGLLIKGEAGNELGVIADPRAKNGSAIRYGNLMEVWGDGCIGIYRLLD